MGASSSTTSIRREDVSFGPSEEASSNLLAYHDRKRDEFMRRSDQRCQRGEEYQFVNTDSLLWSSDALSGSGRRRKNQAEPPMLVFALWLRGRSVAEATAHRVLRARLIASVSSHAGGGVRGIARGDAAPAAPVASIEDAAQATAGGGATAAAAVEVAMRLDTVWL